MQYLLFFVCYSLHRHVIYTNGISAAAVVATALATPASIALTRRVGWCSLKTMLQFSLMNTFIIWKIINYTSSTLQPEQSLYLVSYADSERADSAIQLAGTCFLFSLLCWLQHEIIDHRSLFLFNSHIHEHIHHADYFHFPNELMLTENCFFSLFEILFSSATFKWFSIWWIANYKSKTLEVVVLFDPYDVLNQWISNERADQMNSLIIFAHDAPKL